jgi:hypothetical protein
MASSAACASTIAVSRAGIPSSTRAASSIASRAASSACDGPACGAHLVARDQLPAGLVADTIELDDPVVLLVPCNAHEGLLVHAQAPQIDGVGFAGLLVLDRQPQHPPRRIDCLDHQVVIAGAGVDVGDAPNARRLVGPIGDAQDILLSQCRSCRLQPVQGGMGRLLVLVLQGRPAQLEVALQRLASLVRLGQGHRLGVDARQVLRQGGLRRQECVIMDAGGQHHGRGDGADPFSPTTALDIDPGEPCRKRARRRLVGEAPLLEGRHTLLDHVIRYIDPLCLIDLA